MDFSKADLIFDLAREAESTLGYSSKGEIRMNKSAKASKILKKLLPKPKPQPAVVSLKWTDFQAPTYTLAFWENLVETVKEFVLAQKKKKVRVIFCCIGGHGRTGTALAVVLNLLGVIEDEDPVAWVRKNYCEKTVESESQITYVEKMTGLEVEVEPAKGHTAKGNYGFHNATGTQMKLGEKPAINPDAVFSQGGFPTQKCPECGSMRYPIDLVCYRCHELLPAWTGPEPDYLAERRCETCGQKATYDEYWCTGCGEELPPNKHKNGTVPSTKNKFYPEILEELAALADEAVSNGSPFTSERGEPSSPIADHIRFAIYDLPYRIISLTPGIADMATVRRRLVT